MLTDRCEPGSIGGRKDVDDAHRADADHMGEPEAGPRMLARAGFAAELARDLANLADAGRTDRMPHRQKAARGIDRNAPADVEIAARQLSGGLPGRADAQRLDVEQLLDREAVVKFDDVEVAG